MANITVLVVGGGGGGGRSDANATGGAGAGGLVYKTDYEVTPGEEISVTIGAGGAGCCARSRRLCPSRRW